MSDPMVTVQDLVKWGLDCPMCGSKKFNSGYHEHNHLCHYICEVCGIRWQEDLMKLKKDNPTEKDWKLWIKDVKYYRKHKPYKDGIYKGTSVGGFVWVLHKIGELKPVRDSRSADGTDFKDFGQNPENIKKGNRLIMVNEL